MTDAIHKFATKVDRRSRRAMAKFLAGHFRYDTMSSWNRSTSYANNVKVHNVLPHELAMKAYDLLDIDEAYDDVRDLIADFDEEHSQTWQVGFNGRSSGYLVLYRGGRKRDEHKRQCHDCGQLNFDAASTVCGRCRSENMHDYSGWVTFTNPGLSVDEDGLDYMLDPEEWSMSALRDRVELVQRFDRLCDDVVAAFITVCESYDVVDEQILVARTIKVLTAKES